MKPIIKMYKKSSYSSNRSRYSGVSLSRQRGLILMIALIVLVAMSLAGIALVRSVDTTTTIAGNLTFRKSAVQQADVGLEAANNALQNLITNIDSNDLPNKYYAFEQAVNAKGIPTDLQTIATYDSKFTKLTDATTNAEIRYIIERMCDATGAVTPATCSMWGGQKAQGGDIGKTALTPEGGAMFRVTVRVDGAHNTVSYVQALLRQN